MLRRYPVLAAHMALQSIRALVVELRHGCREVPGVLGADADPALVEAVVRVYEFHGTHAAVLERDVGAVAAALAGDVPWLVG